MTHQDTATRRDIGRALLAAACALLGGAAVGVLGAAAWFRWDGAAADVEAPSTSWGPEGPR